MFTAVLTRGRGAGPTGAALLEEIRSTHDSPLIHTVDVARFTAAEATLDDTPQASLAMGSREHELVAWLRLDNRAELAADVGLGRSELDSVPDRELLLRGYERWGADVVERLEGDFSFALWDPAQQRLLAARDSSGIRPLYVAESGQVVALATTPRVLVALTGYGIDDRVSTKWLARHLGNAGMDWVDTPFVGVRQVPPGHLLLADDAGVRTRRYHEFVDDAIHESSRDERRLTAYKAALYRSMEDRLRVRDALGVESSGGIDSSTVLAIAATLRPEWRSSMHTFAFAHAELEPEYVLETSRVHGVLFNHVLSGQFAIDGRESQRLGWRVLGHPAQHGNSTGHLRFYQLAQGFGVSTLLSGHGGDEVVTNNGALALRERVAQGDFRGVYRDHVAPRWRRPLSIAKMRATAGRPRPSHLDGLVDALLRGPLRSDVIERYGVLERVRRASRYDADHHSVNAFVLKDRWAPFVSIRTAECSIVAASFGVDYRWPLLDRRLMQQYLSTPSIWKFGEGTGRYLHRRAIDDVVPHKVAWKPTKDMLGLAFEPGGGEPVHVNRLHDAVRELLDDVPDPASAPRATQRALRRAMEASDWLSTTGYDTTS